MALIVSCLSIACENTQAFVEKNTMKPKDVYIILHNIRSAYNVGSIFRTADAAGILKIYLTGYTPTPKDRFGREQKDIAKTALGAQYTIFWEYKKSPQQVIARLKKNKVSIVGVEQTEGASDYKKITLHGPTAFVFGNEVRGISPRLQKHFTGCIFIPMRGDKESLNVSVAAGVVLFRVLNV